MKQPEDKHPIRNMLDAVLRGGSILSYDDLSIWWNDEKYYFVLSFKNGKEQFHSKELKDVLSQFYAHWHYRDAQKIKQLWNSLIDDD